MSFLHHISFVKPDPLGAGLAEEIAAEQSEPEAITLEESLDANELRSSWERITDELSHDPEWAELSVDE